MCQFSFFYKEKSNSDKESINYKIENVFKKINVLIGFITRDSIFPVSFI